MPISIEPIHPSQAEALSALSKAIYKEHYLHLWHPGGAEWYQEEYAYPVDKLRAELEDKNNLHFMALDNGMACGYLKIRINAALEGHTAEECLEIERIYLHKATTGKGIGKQLMQLAEKIAQEKGKKTCFLKAMDSSTDALAFYQKMGYTVCGSLVLPFEVMKEIYRGMYILSKNISA